MLKKSFFRIGILLFGIMLVFTIFGCDNGNNDNGDNGNDGPFTVKFIANGGTPAPSDQTIDKGSTVKQPAAMTNSNHEDFNGWFANSACTVPYNFASNVNSNLTLYAKWGYFVGDTGPAGGKIFYVKSGTSYPDWKYLEASPAELPACRWAWGNYGSADDPVIDYVVEDSKGTAIGTGRANTDAILGTLSLGGTVTVPAASGAENYTAGGYGDWFLPGKDELNALYQSHILSAYTGEHYYWTSSQHDDPGRSQCAWAQDFGTADPGMQNEEAKNSDLRVYVRPIRSFFCSHE